MQTGLAQHQQRPQGGAVFLYDAEPRFDDPFMGCQRLFQHRQRDAFFFQLDDTVQSPKQLEATIDGEAHSIGSVFDMAIG
ncbi:hypothetical protein D3C84_1084370 [compost metagenome]